MSEEEHPVVDYSTFKEANVEIIENGEYKNLPLRSNLKTGVKGIPQDHYIIVEKMFVGGYEMEKSKFKGVTSFLCNVKYKGEEVSFFLNNKVNHKKEQILFDYDNFEAAGGEGDKVKIYLHKESYVNKKTGAEGLKQVLSFGKVE